MELAFELPDHLPRSKSQQPQTSTAVLTALAEASPLTLVDTTRWVNELEEAVLETKVRPPSNVVSMTLITNFVLVERHS